MIDVFYIVTLILVLIMLKSHPASMIFVVLLNILTGFSPIIKSFNNFDIVSFDEKLVISLLITFNLSILFFQSIYISLKIKRSNVMVFKNYKYTKFILFLFSFLTLIVIYQNINQGISVIANGYISGYKNSNEGVIKATSLFPFLLIFYFFMFVLYLKDKKRKYLLAMLIVLISYSMYGSRSFFLYTSLSIMMTLILTKKISYKRFFMIFMLIIPVFLVAGYLREGNGGDGFHFLFRMALELSNVPMIISNLNVLDNLNQSIVSLILTILPQSVTVPLGVIPVNSLATEFVTNYDPGWATAGGGFGFTLIGEIYYRFGYFGLIFIPYIFIFVFNKLENYYLVGDIFDKALLLSFYYGILMWVRGDFIEISRLLIIIVFFYISKRLVISDGR